MTDFNKITNVEFDRALADILDTMSAREVLAIPGVYEATSECLNNDILDYAWENFTAPRLESDQQDHDPENIYNLPGIRQSIEEDQK